MTDKRVWLAFVLLSLAWGTSFLFIKIALETMLPFSLVAVRLIIGAIGLQVVLRGRGLQLPRDPEVWKHLVFMGVVGTAVPFTLFTLAEAGPNGLDSGITSVLNSTVPIWAILLAGFFLRSEQLSRGKLIGVGTGFVGILLLFRGSIQGEWGGSAQMMMGLGAAVFYAIVNIYGKKYLQGQEPISLAAGQVAIAAVVVSATALMLEPIAGQSMPFTTLFALLWLGLMGSCLAYIMYYVILLAWGATRVSLVTYTMPVIGVAAGWLFLNEVIGWEIVLGGLLILSGVWGVNKANN